MTLTSSMALAQTPPATSPAVLTTRIGHEVNVSVQHCDYTEPEVNVSMHGPKSGGEYAGTFSLRWSRRWSAQFPAWEKNPRQQVRCFHGTRSVGCPKEDLMKSHNRRVWFGITIAVVLFFLLPSRGSSVLSSAVPDATDGVTHVIEFVVRIAEPPDPLSYFRPNPWEPRISPAETVICVGDSVEFKNNWIGQVNAFSYSKALRFDVGRFRPGTSRTVGPFPEPGVVRVFDEIHSETRGLIFVVDCSKKGRTAGLEDGLEQAKQFHANEALRERQDSARVEEEMRKEAEAAQRRPKKTYRVRVHGSGIPSFGDEIFGTTLERIRVDRDPIMVCTGDSVELSNETDDVLIFAAAQGNTRLGTPATPPGESAVLGPFTDRLSGSELVPWNERSAGTVLVTVLDNTQGNRSVGQILILVVDCDGSGGPWAWSLENDRRMAHQEIDREKSDPDPSARNTPAGDRSNYRIEPGSLPPPRVQHSPGLETLRFQTPQGHITVRFPDDASAGDTISGTVVAEPDGRSDDERATNQSKLEGYVVGVDSVDPKGRPRVSKLVVSTSARIFRLTLPPSVGNTPSGPAIGCHLYAGVFEELAQGTVPMGLAAPGSEIATPAAREYQFPALSQQGHPLQIVGRFDGNFSNTSLHWTRRPSPSVEKNTENVSGGFELIAESPHKVVLTAPASAVGPVEIHLKENGVETTGQTRIVGVDLAAPKTSLLKGERTTLSIKVSGLQGITEPVPLHVVKGGVVSLQGGNVQTILIKPGDVKRDGTYRITRTITGQQAGGFSVTVTVVTKDVR